MSSGSQSSPSTNMNTSMQPPAQLLFTPLMISMVGVVSTALALLLYHIILSRYCLRRGRGRLRAALSRRFTWNNKASDGVDEKVLSTIPIISYSTAVGGLFGADRIECTVCLSEIEEGETVRLLPSCRHAFHVECIDEWFASHSNCPVCRASIVAPMSPVLPIATDLENLDSDEGSGDHAEGDDLSVSDRQVGSKSNGSLRHCASVVFPTEDELASSKVLRRSASMDAPCVSLKVKPENEKETSSSSKAAGLVKRNSYKLRSLRRLWSNQSDTSDHGILPR